jgi:GWxTD domain-containing protein
MRKKGNWIFGFIICLTLASFFSHTAPAQEKIGSEQKEKEPLSEWSKQWLEEVVPYIITDAERDVFVSLPTEADRGKFIESFWKKRDPNPQTPENEFKIDYYSRIALANKFFGYSGIQGWRTDRGKIYILLGPPSEIQREMNPTQTAYSVFHGPKEVWNYWGLANPKLPYNMEFVFVDKLGSGNYVLENSLRLTDMGSTPFDIDSSHYFFDDMEYMTEAMRNPFDNLDKLRGIITTQVTYDRIPIQFDLFFLKGDGQRTYVPLLLEVPYSALTHKEIATELHFSVTAMVDASNSLGQIIFERSKDFDFIHLPSEASTLENKTFQMQTSLSLEPGTYKIHLLILDNVSGAVGTVHQEFLVPDFNTEELSLSDIFLWSEERSQKREIDSTKEKISADTHRTFSSDEEINILFEVYSLSLDPETGVNRFTSEYLVYEGDKLLTCVPVPRAEPTSDKDCRIQSSFRLKNFKTGEYKLRVHVVDSISGKELSKGITFSVIR